jgi:hypothetical protein
MPPPPPVQWAGGARSFRLGVGPGSESAVGRRWPQLEARASPAAGDLGPVLPVGFAAWPAGSTRTPGAWACQCREHAQWTPCPAAPGQWLGGGDFSQWGPVQWDVRCGGAIRTFPLPVAKEARSLAVSMQSRATASELVLSQTNDLAVWPAYTR